MRRFFLRLKWWIAAVAVVALGIAMMRFTGSFAERQLNLLLITLDTTRADRIGAYGYAAAQTPALDRLARSGVVFDRAYATAPITLTSHASLLTGLYPPEHGLLTNGRGRLDESIPTLASLLNERNYDTAAFVASFVLDSKFGLDRGFVVYDDAMVRTMPGEGHSHDHRERDGRTVVERALAWLKSGRKKPFFCWIHFYDPHSPYDAHVDEFRDQFRQRPYDGEIAYVDRQIERILQYVEAAGLRQETLIVVVGDHGEGLGDHIEQTHGYTLYNSTQHVPLIFTGPKWLMAGHRHPGPVSLVDVFPTLCDVLAIPTPAHISGRTFSAALKGRDVGLVECYAATDDPFLQEGWCPLRSLTTDRWKYIRSVKPELYDLRADPGETHNLADSNPEAASELERRLSDLEASMSLRASTPVSLTERERGVLQSLGYLGGASALGTAVSNSGLIDVKDMLAIDAEARESLYKLQTGRIEEAIVELQAIAASAPNHAASRVFLAQALEGKHRLQDAIACYEEVLRIKPDHLEALSRLAMAHERLKNDDAAVAYWDALLVHDPASTAERVYLGRALLRLGNQQRAIEQFREALRLEPQLPDVRVDLSETLEGLGEIDESLRLLKEELAQNPGNVRARARLAARTAVDDPDLAARLFTEALQIQPDNPHVHFEIGKFLLLRNRPRDAVKAFETTLQLMPDHPQARDELHKIRSARSE